MFNSEHYFTKIMKYAKHRDIGIFDAVISVAEELDLEVEELLERLDENVVKLIKEDVINRKIYIPSETDEIQQSFIENSLY